MHRFRTVLSSRVIAFVALIVGIAGMAILRAQSPGRTTASPTPQLKSPRADVVLQPRPIYGEPRPVIVRGYLAAFIPGTQDEALRLVKLPSPRGHNLYLPGVNVYLLFSNSKRSGAVRTDLSGRFSLPAAPQIRFNVCWTSKSYGEGCSERVYLTQGGPLFVSTVLIPWRRSDKTTAIYGRVQLADGSLPRLFEPAASVNSFGWVDLLNEDGKLVDSVYVNNVGEYLLPVVPNRSNIALRARIENASTDHPIRTAARLDRAPLHSIDLRIANSAPLLEPVIPADAGGRRIKAATPGAVVFLTARSKDPDGDHVNVVWTANAGSGTLSDRAGDKVKWKLPNHRGLYEVLAVAYDGKGGYARSRVALVANESGGVTFSGFVRSTSGDPVDGATIEIGGEKVAETKNGGYFSTLVHDANRYVFNIRRTGFAFYSKIYDAGVTGGRWTLTPATVVTVPDATHDIDVTNERKTDNCPGPSSMRGDFATFPPARRLAWIDREGNPRAAPWCKPEDLPPAPWEVKFPRECGPGVKVHIPGGSLEDYSGHLVTANVTVSVSTIDLYSPEQMPGDYTVAQADGSKVVMQSFGAGVIDITAGDRPLRLRAPATAKVTIPVDRSQLAAGAKLPSTIPLLHYDEQAGVWRQDGEATLNGSEYVANVTHFSPINCDTLKQNQSCVRLFMDAMPPSFEIEITVPQLGNAAPKMFQRHIDNSVVHEEALYNLPNSKNIVVAAYTVPSTLLGTYVIDTGPTQENPAQNQPSGPPYLACHSSATLTPQTYPDAPLGAGEFLHGLYSFESTNLDELNAGGASDQALATAFDTATGDYYNQVDPTTPKKRDTLAHFISTNSMGGADEIRVAYANGGDLGFGRDMHCVNHSSNLACYVTNYGNFATDDQDDANAAASQSTVGSSNLVATVAMEYSPIENPDGTITNTTKVVKFYVYNAAGTALLRNANLDQYGARPVPQLCMVCHNGNAPTFGAPGSAPPFPDRNSVDLGARFLPFDLHFYKFSNTVPGFDQVSLEPQFANLNQQIVLNGNAGPAITELINAWYHNGTITTQDQDIIITGWNDQPIKQTMYHDVVARACRTCHAAQIFTALQFTNSDDMVTGTSPNGTPLLGAVEDRVCAQHTMPHARATHRLFWNSINPHMPARLQVYGDHFASVDNGWGGQTCGAFNLPPVGVFDTDIQPVLNRNGCPACHTGSSPPVNLNLDQGNAYAQTVNQNALEFGSQKRINPFDATTSYLVRKIDGSAGIVGSQMPLGCSGATCMSQADRDIIRNWVNVGAPP
jgi:hypothetical protein